MGYAFLGDGRLRDGKFKRDKERVAFVHKGPFFF